MLYNCSPDAQTCFNVHVVADVVHLSGEVGTSGNALALVPAPESSSHTGSGAVAVRQDNADAAPTWALNITDSVQMLGNMLQTMQQAIVPAVATGHDYREYQVHIPF